MLHVDDSTSFVDLTADYLRRESDRFEMTGAAGPGAGLSELDDDTDCVVSDYEMPGRDGLEFLESVRADYPDLPFVLFTGKGSEEVASEAISAGVTDYMRKQPGSERFELLANRIENAVEAFRAHRHLEQRNRRLETLISNLPGMVYRCRNAPDWPMEYVEGECESLTGYAADTIESGGVAWGSEVIHPDDRDETWATIQEAVDAREHFEVTYRIVTREGAERTVWERGRGVYEDGDVVALEGFITDASGFE